MFSIVGLQKRGQSRKHSTIGRNPQTTPEYTFPRFTQVTYLKA